MYNSNASIDTLNLLKTEKLIDLKLAFKRLDAECNCVIEDRKFLAIFQKLY